MYKIIIILLNLLLFVLDFGCFGIVESNSDECTRLLYVSYHHLVPRELSPPCQLLLLLLLRLHLH